jgi:group I intron endonuclease
MVQYYPRDLTIQGSKIMFNNPNDEQSSESSNIYKILFPSNKVYIGQSWDYIRRFSCYKRLECKEQPKLYNALNKYGWDNTEQELLDTCYTQEDSDEAEDYWINYYDAIHNGYNCKQGGSNGKLSLETCEKVSVSLQKYWANMTPEEYELVRERTPRGEEHWLFGKLPWNKGMKTPEEIIDKQRGENHYNWGKPAWNSGLKLPQEHCEKFPHGEEHHFWGMPAHNRQRVEIDGIIYESKTAAHKALGIPRNGRNKIEKMFPTFRIIPS